MKIEIAPLANISVAQDSAFDWEAKNADPQFSVSNATELAGFRIVIKFKFTSRVEAYGPAMLYWDDGGGMSENKKIPLLIDRIGYVNQEVVLPFPLLTLRLDPMSTAGQFSISDFDIVLIKQELSAETDFVNDLPDAYDYLEWITQFEPKAIDYHLFNVASLHLPQKLVISVLMPTYNSPEIWLRRALDSVLAQTYADWELCVADDASTEPHVGAVLREYASRDPRIKVAFRPINGHISATSNSALVLATGAFVGLLDHDDELHPLSLYWIAETISAKPDAQLIYSDEDKMTEDGIRKEPYFKSDFNYDLFLGQNMVSHFGVYKASTMREIGGFRLGYEGSQDYDLALRMLDRVGASKIHHISRVLYHWRVHPQSTASTLEAKPYAHIAAMKAIDSHLKNCRVDGYVEPSQEVVGFNRVNYNLPANLPSVEIVIPTKDGAEILKQCVTSILQKTSYSNFSITIIDNNSVLPETFLLFDDLVRKPNIRVIADRSEFNFSKLNNSVALQSGADFVCLLNNDTEVITSGWLDEMVGVALQPGVGCVGARLWYPDNSLQHGGVILGLGASAVAGHSHHRLPKGMPGYFGRVALRNTLSAVTGACLLVRTSIYKQVGGLNEDLRVAFNDVDFCLRVMSLGLRNVWTPYAELFHHESITRGLDTDLVRKKRFDKESKYMIDRWGGLLDNDPYYSPNLTLKHSDFSYAWPPRNSNAIKSKLP